MKKVNRKISAMLVIFMLVAGMQLQVLANEIEGTENAGSAVDGIATYVSTIPTIDGIIDDVWNTTESFYCNEPEVEGTATGYAKLLWTEDTLYLMAKVEDSTFSEDEKTNMGNAVTFWVSETRNATVGFDLNGDWIYCVNTVGILRYRNEVGSTAQCATQRGKDGYVIEVAVPVQTPDFQYADGGLIGFNFTIDDDIDGDHKSDYTGSWRAVVDDVWFSESAQDLNKVQLVAKDGESGVNIEEKHNKKNTGLKGEKSLNIVYIVIGLVAYAAGVLTLIGFWWFTRRSRVNRKKQNRRRRKYDDTN